MMKTKLLNAAILSICMIVYADSAYSQQVRPGMGPYGSLQTSQTNDPTEIRVYNDSMQIVLKNPPVITVTPIVTMIDNSEKLGLQVPVHSGDMLVVAKSWKKYLKSIVRKRTRFQSSPSGDYYFTDNAYVPRLSANTIDVYAELQPFEEGEGIFLNVFFDLGGAFLSPEEHPDKYLEASAFLQDFAVVESIKAVETTLFLEEERLLLLKEERNGLKKKEEEIQYEIDGYLRAIEDLQGSLDANAEQVDQKNKETKDQISTVEQLKLNLRSFSINPE